MKELGIFGASGFSREVADIALSLGYEPFLISEKGNDQLYKDLPYEVLEEKEAVSRRHCFFSIGIGDNQLRARIADRYKDSLRFVNLIHPSAVFGYKMMERLELSDGLIICAGVILTNNIDIGNFTIINLNATIGHDCVVDDYVNISPGVSVSGNVHLESGCSIGTGASIIQGHPDNKLKIGTNTVIGAGSVVNKTCLPESTYVGVPARRLQ